MAARHRWIASLTLGAVLFIGLLFPPERVAAQTFMDLLFGVQPYDRYYEQRYRERRYRYRRYRERRYRDRRSLGRWYGDRSPAPRIKIAAPRYYRYKPERRSAYSLASLANALASPDLPAEKRNEPLVLAREKLSAVAVQTS